LPAQPPAPEGRRPGASRAGLPREDVRKLQATLVELTECRRLIDAVLTEAP